MILLILVLLLDTYLLRKYEKGNEHIYTFILATSLTILYYYMPIIFLSNGVTLFLEITLSIFIFFQIYFPLINKIKDKDYLVVLGCGLLDGYRLSPLLMQRLNAAIHIYESRTCRIVVSGGKGKDEEISEASAMKDYLISKEVNEEDILCEDESISTKENLIYSMNIIGNEFMIITSDYHALRVYILSKLLGLNISIYTSRTIYYYKFYAIIREYFALLFLFKEIVILFYFLILYFNHYFLFNL